MRKAGYIYETNDGKFAIAYNYEQENKFLIMDKLVVHLFEDRSCMKPVIDPATGKGKKVLKSKVLLKHIGFND